MSAVPRASQSSAAAAARACVDESSQRRPRVGVRDRGVHAQRLDQAPGQVHRAGCRPGRPCGRAPRGAACGRPGARATAAGTPRAPCCARSRTRRTPAPRAAGCPGGAGPARSAGAASPRRAPRCWCVAPAPAARPARPRSDVEATADPPCVARRWWPQPIAPALMLFHLPLVTLFNNQYGSRKAPTAPPRRRHVQQQLPRTASPPPSSVRRVIVASLIGTSLEWYDFFIYGTAAALVFNKLFFPSFEPLVGTLLAFATYAVGFIARPLGGMVFGHYGDKLGRKNVLVVTLLLMGIATFAIGAAADLRHDRGVGAGPAGRAALPAGARPRRGVGRRGPDDAGVRRRPAPRAQRELAAGRRTDRAAARQRRPVADGRAHHGRGVPVLGLAGAVPAQRAARARRAVDPDDDRREPAVPGGRGRGHQGTRADRRGAAPLPASRCCWRSARGSVWTSPSTRSSCSSRRTSPPTSSCRAATRSTRCSSPRRARCSSSPGSATCPTGSAGARSTSSVRSARRSGCSSSSPCSTPAASP